MNSTDYNTPHAPNWCPGCGDFGIWTAFKAAAAKQAWDNTNTAITAGIGCHGHIVNFVKLTSFEGLHGRALPVASGIKMANPDLNVIAFTGDGDSLAEGGNHFMHAARRNQNITVILHDNAVYGLTTGQTSPASPEGYKSKSTPEGNIDHPIHPLSLAITAGATFAARGYAANIPQITDLIIQAVNHNGFSIVDILQPCVTWNKIYTHTWYSQNIYLLDESYDPTDKVAALLKSMEWGEKQIPLGVIYQSNIPSCEDQLQAYQTDPTPVIKRPVVKRDISDLFDHLR